MTAVLIARVITRVYNLPGKIQVFIHHETGILGKTMLLGKLERKGKIVKTMEENG